MKNPYVAVYYSELELLRDLNNAAFRSSMEPNPNAGQPTASGKGVQGEFRKRKLKKGEKIKHQYPTGADILVLLQIKKHYNPNPGNKNDGPGYAWPGMRTLQDVTGLKRSTIKRSIKNLETFGMIRTITKWGIGNQYHKFSCACEDCLEKTGDAKVYQFGGVR